MNPRLDTMRNRIAATRDLLTMIGEELEDLHVLAYDRPSAVDEAKVAGGSANYYLDTHGDKRARDAYRNLWTSLDNICTTIDGASNIALNLLRKGDTPTNQGPRTVHLSELGDLIAAQARRAKSDGYSPVRRGPQPDEAKAMDARGKDRDDEIRTLKSDLKDAREEIQRLRSQRPQRLAS